MAQPPATSAETPLSNGRVVLTVGTLAFGWVFIYLDRVLIFPLLPLVGDEFGLSDTLRGLIVSAYFLFYVAMQIPAGVLGDRFGLARVVFVMYLLVGLALVGIGLLSYVYLILLVFVALQGLGAGAYYAASYGITISVVPLARRGISSAVVTMGMAGGLALGLSIAGPLAEAFGSWRLPFLLMAVPTFAMAMMIFFVNRGTPAARGTSSSGGLLRAFQNKHLMILSAAAFCSLYGFWILISWAPTFFVEQRGFDLASAGQLTAVVALTSIPGALFWGRLSDRLGRKKISVGLLLGGALTIFGVGYLSSGTALFFVLAGYGLVSALAWNPVLVAWAGDLAALRGDGIGTVIGILNAFAVGSSFVGPAVTGIISDITGSLASGFYVGAASLLLGALLTLMIKDTRAPAATAT